MLECFPEALQSPRRAIEAERRALEAERKALEKERRELAERHRAEQESRERMLRNEQEQREAKSRLLEDSEPQTSITGSGPDMTVQIQGAGSGSNTYFARVQQLIIQHWTAPPVEMTGNALTVVIRFRLNCVGVVSGVVVEHSSGSKYYDLAAKRAVLSGNPFPPCPMNLTEPYYDIHLRFGIGGTSTVPKTPVTDRASFSIAYSEYLNGRYDMAVLGFQEFIKDFPSAPLVPHAYHWLGESYYNLRDYNRATQAYETIVVKYPNSEPVPSALYKIGLCAAEMYDTGKARQYFQRTIEEFPSSEQAPLAKAKLAQLR